MQEEWTTKMTWQNKVEGWIWPPYQTTPLEHVEGGEQSLLTECSPILCQNPGMEPQAMGQSE
jgi:hypothetical protein